MVTFAAITAVAIGAARAEIPKHRAEQIRKAAPDRPQVRPTRPRRVLIWNTPAHLMPKDPHKGYCIPYGAYAIKTLGEKTGAFTPVVSDDVSVFLPANIKRFDAIVLNNASGAWITPGDEAVKKLKAHGDKQAVEKMLRKSLLGFVSGGGGIVAYHYAMGANRHWPEFRELFGAAYWGHPWNEEVGVLVEEPDHPVLAAFGGKKTFRVTDEIFQFRDPYSRDKLRVLLSLDVKTTNMGVKWIHRTDNDFALAWVKAYGKGRVFYTALGHRTEIYWNPTILRFYLDGIQFATGDLKAPTSPRDRKSWPDQKGPGPTPPDVRAARMKAKNVKAPTKQEIARIRAAAPDKAPAKPAKPRKVLVWGHSWAHTPNPFAEKALEILGARTGAFEAVVSDDPRLLLPDRLGRFDALVMNNIHEREPFLPADLNKLPRDQQAAARKLDRAIKKSILEFVAGGKGVVGIHAATAAFQKWREYGEMMGGYYGGHIMQDVAIEIEDTKHPINAPLGGKTWRIHDEVYIFGEPYSRKKLHVLLSLDLKETKDPGKRPDKDYAVSWVRRYGKGRVFYCALGHCPATYWEPVFLRHILAGIQFATGDLPGGGKRSFRP